MITGMIMEADKSRAAVRRLGTQERLWCMFPSEAGKLENQEEPMFQFKSEVSGEKKTSCPSWKLWAGGVSFNWGSKGRLGVYAPLAYSVSSTVG